MTISTFSKQNGLRDIMFNLYQGLMEIFIQNNLYLWIIVQNFI